MKDPTDQEKALFLEALEKTSAAAQDAYLREACQGNEDMFARIRSLLHAHQDAGDFLVGEGSVAGDSDTRFAAPIAEGPGSVIGRYKLLEKLGEGGFGVVYMAEQKEPVKRRVALKIIKLGMDTKQVVARFEAERQALAMMNHPNIAKVLDGGATDTGRPYFVMELVTGVSLLEFCDSRKLSILERLQLFVQVCQAIQHAHQKGVIHRDIKPSNVLVTMQDDRPVPKVIDFGIAKATQQELTEKTIFTRCQEFVGTPAYMSPEQAQFSGLDIDTRTDIYSLGVLLYELLTGRTPFATDDLIMAGYDGMRRIIREKEPLKPSAWLQALPAPELAGQADLRQIEPGRLPARVAGDLDWIVMKALEKDRARRYESAAALARDIEAHLGNVPISAMPPALGYRFGKFARRHRVTLTTSLAIAASLVAGTIVSLNLAFRANRAERETREALTKELAARHEAQAAADQARQAQQRANEEAEIAEAVNRFMNEEFLGQADPVKEPDRNITLRQLLNNASARLETHFQGAPLVEASIRHTVGQVYMNLGEYNSAENHARRAAALRHDQLGDTHPDSLRSRTLLAAVQVKKGRFTEIEPTLESLHATAASQLGEDNDLTLEIMYWLTQTYLRTFKADIAEAMTTRMLELSQQVLPPDHWLRAGIVAVRGQFFLTQNQFKEAEDFYASWLASNRDRFGEEHPYTLNLMHSLAYALEWQGKHAEARNVYRQTLAAKERVLGHEHPSRLSTMEQYASFRTRMREFDEAETMLQEVFETRKKVLGKTHPSTRATMYTFNGLYGLSQRHDENRAFLRSVLREDPENLFALDFLAQYLTLDSLRLLVADSERVPQAWRYTTTDPGDNWMKLGYQDTDWLLGDGVFGNSTILHPKTHWDTRSIWIRREFTLEEVPAGRLVLRLMQDDSTTVYLNGELIFERQGWTGRRYRLSYCLEKAHQLLQPGRNVLAIRCQNTYAEGLIDAGLYIEPLESSLFAHE